MNYRTMIKGALALSLSLIVGSTWAGQQYGATFEQTPVGTVVNDFAYTEGDGITNAKYRVTQDVTDPYGWFAGSDEGDESKIIAANGGQALQLNTDSATLTNKLAKAVADEINANGIAKAGAYFEMETKFVASDTLDAGIEGGTDATKFALYAYCNEEAETVTTNLVVYHAYYDVNGVTCYTNDVISGVTIDTEKYTKLRIVVSQVDKQDYEEDPFAEPDYIKVFTVSVDGVLATSLTAYDAEGATPGSLFVTVNDTANKDVASLNFKGTGEIDNINVGVIEEAQPPDDTWTIEGFNAGGTWPLPTASTDTALFYSNLVVNIDAADSSIGRTINAAWIGAKIIAPEAVTAETVGNWKFDLSATQTGLSFDQCKDGEYFMYLWVPVTAAKVRAAIANQSDIVYTVSVYQEGDSANAQPLTLNICPKNITITNTDEVEGEGAETIDVDDWQEQGAVEPTVITVACVNGATYTEADGVYTFAAPEGYVVNSIYTNGVDTGSTTTFTTNGLTGTVNVVAAAKKVRPAVAHKWYENPGLVVKVPHPLNDSCVGQNWGHDLTDSFVGGSAGYTGGFARLLSIDSLEAGNAEPIYTINVNAAPLNIASFRGSAISTELNVMLVGAATGKTLASLPLSDETLAWDENAFRIWTDNDSVPDAMYFADGGRTLYANAYIGNQSALYKYSVLNGLKSSGTNLVLEATWNVGTRTRNTVFVEVGNKVFAYFHDNGTIKCIDLSDTSSSPVDTVATVTSKYDSVGATSSHLYVVHGSTGAMDIYDIAADGSVTLFKSFTGAELGAAFGTAELKTATSTAIVVTEDEATAIFGGVYDTSHYIFVAQYVEPPAPTVISVAKLSATGAMVGDAAPALTATVTDSDGETVDAADYTIDASAIDMTTAGLYPVIITATGDLGGVLTNYFAVMNLTWFNGTPTQKALINPQNMTLTGAHYMHTTQDGAYLALGASNGNGTGWGHALYSVATLTSIYGTCQGVWEVAHFTNGGGKGMTANTTSGIMLNGGGNVGGTVATQSTFTGYDIGDLANIGTSSNMVQETYTAEWDGSGYAAGQIMDGIDFNHAGTKVFGNNAGTDGPWVYQLAIDKAAKTMTWEATYTSDFARVRSVSSYYIDGKDYVFIGEGASSGHGEIAVIDPGDGSITTICAAADDFTTAEFPSGRYFTNVKVSGIASGEMYLYGCTDKGEVVVWALGHDAVTGEWKTAPVGNITSAQTAALNSKASVGNCRAFEVSDDNNAGFLYVQSSPGQFAVVTDISLAQRKALASATLTPASSDKDVALGAITATVLDENGDTVAASEYTITTNLIDIATVGEYTVTITPVEGSVYSNAVTAVYTISEAAPAQKPAWAADSGDGSDQDPYWAWATAHAAGQDLYAEGADYSAQYLMNVDADKTPVLKIDSIQVGSGAAVIIVSATDGTDPISLATINGVLNVATGDTLTALTPKALGRAPTVSQDGKAMVVISAADGKFYRARVDFAAAETALTPVVISGGE